MIGKKYLLLAFALGFALCSHLRPVCNFTVNGEPIGCRCSPAAAKAAQQCALAAAEEILPGDAALPTSNRQLKFSFRPGSDSAPLLSDALLRSTPGVTAASCVYVDGLCLGAVADSGAFQQSFARYIQNTLPTWAKSGSVRGMQLIPRYTRTEFEVPFGDMILLVTGLSPVMYTDFEGRVSPV